MLESRDVQSIVAFDYLYRDAGNFKSFGTIILRGNLSLENQRRIINAMESEEFFVAEQVSIPSLYNELFKLSGGRIPSDHAWHSFSQFRQLDLEPESEIVWGSSDDLLSAFEAVSEWDISMSPNYGC